MMDCIYYGKWLKKCKVECYAIVFAFIAINFLALLELGLQIEHWFENWKQGFIFNNCKIAGHTVATPYKIIVFLELIIMPPFEDD